METWQFSRPWQFMLQASAGKIICTIFCDAESVLLIDVMLHKVTVTGLYYADLLYFTKLCVTIKEKH